MVMYNVIRTYESPHGPDILRRDSLSYLSCFPAAFNMVALAETGISVRWTHYITATSMNLLLFLRYCLIRFHSGTRLICLDASPGGTLCRFILCQFITHSTELADSDSVFCLYSGNLANLASCTVTCTKKKRLLEQSTSYFLPTFSVAAVSPRKAPVQICTSPIHHSGERSYRYGLGKSYSCNR